MSKLTPEMEQLLKQKAEGYLVKALDDAIEFGEMYAASTPEAMDDTVIAGVKLLRGLIVDLIDKIDGEDNN